MNKYSTCNDGECKCGLIWDKEKDIPIAKVLTCKDKEMLGTGLIPESDEFKRVYKLLAAAPELLERLEKLLFLHQCEMEGIENPSFEEWEKEIRKAQETINKAKGGIE